MSPLPPYFKHLIEHGPEGAAEFLQNVRPVTVAREPEEMPADGGRRPVLDMAGPRRELRGIRPRGPRARPPASLRALSRQDPRGQAGHPHLRPEFALRQPPAPRVSNLAPRSLRAPTWATG